MRSSTSRSSWTRRLAMPAGIALLVTSALAAAPNVGVGASPSCSGRGISPGKQATKAFARFEVGCLSGVSNAPFEYQVQLLERDPGPDTRLSTTPWKAAVTDANGRYKGNGPVVACNTEPGAEELYSRVGIRYSGYTQIWLSGDPRTDLTCQ